MGNTYRLTLATAFCGVLITATGCSSQHTKPTAQLATTEAAIAEAIEAGGRKSAAVELQDAEKHFAEANAAVREENFLEAQFLAEKAEADAKLAEARAESRQAKANVQELRESINVLRAELQKQLNRR